MPSGAPLLSVVIVNWNVRDLLGACLRSLRADLLLPAGGYEVLVVDNASADDSVAMLRAEFPDVHLIASPVNLGFGAGCNAAYARTRGEFVLLLNPDTETFDHAIDGLLDVMRAHPRAAIVAPRLVNPDHSFQPAAGGSFPTLANVAWNYLFLKDLLPARWAPRTLFLAGDPQGTLPIDWVSGAAMMLRREAVGAKIFDEDFFMFGEDQDLCDRMGRAGWQVLYTSAHAIVHHHGRSFDKAESRAVQAAAHDGPRRAFRKRHGPIATLLYDAILLAGFAIRWAIFATLARLRPGRGYDERARFSRTYVRTMFRGTGDRGRKPGRA